MTAKNVNVTFLWYYFESIFPLVDTSSISLAAVNDIAADKAHTIGRRAVWRDYVDFFFLLKDGWVSLEEIVGLAKRKFKGEFSEVLFLQQLSYFGDVEAAGVEFVEGAREPDEVKGFLEGEVENYLKKGLGIGG